MKSAQTYILKLLLPSFLFAFGELVIEFVKVGFELVGVFANADLFNPERLIDSDKHKLGIRDAAIELVLCVGKDGVGSFLLGELLVYAAFSALGCLFGKFLFGGGKLFFKLLVMSDFILAFRTSDSDRRTAGITRFVFGLVFFSVLAGREFVIIGFLFVDFNVKLVAEEGKTVTIAVADGVYLRDKLVFTGGKLFIRH